TNRSINKMVRVISVHHFVSQDIHTCEDPVAVTTAPPDYLLLALPQHVVEVRDLAKGGSIVFNFPTVDQVHQMLHCCNGNYVATLELKQNRQGKECTHARIYANWDSPCMVNQGAGCGTGASVQQPMRARIAGRVTPSSAQSGPPSLEMIELPLKRTPNVIACCQVSSYLIGKIFMSTTGNLLVASHKTLMLYHFHMRTHDISRLRFIDFEESGVCVELSFSPSWLSVAEDIIACMAQEYVHVFRLGSGPTDGWKNEGQWPERKAPDSSSECNSVLSCLCKENCYRLFLIVLLYHIIYSEFLVPIDNTLAYVKKIATDLILFLQSQNPYTILIVTGAKETNTEAYINWDEVLKNCTKSKLHHNSFPVTVDLPSIVEERITCCHSSPSGVIQRLSPFQMAPPDMTIMVRCASPSATPWAAKNEVLHLLQLQMATTHVGSGTKQIYSSSSDEFRCLILKPMYVKAGTVRERKGSEGNPMHSKHYSELVSVICLVVTQQEGYLYHFRMQDLQDPSSLQQAACVTVYPFTAPVSSVVMERFVLHALTETGLETYTLRAGHHLMAALDPVNNVTSLKDFLGGTRFESDEELKKTVNTWLNELAAEEYNTGILKLVNRYDKCLIPSSFSSSHCGGAWTLYSLSLPSPAALYSDILSVGSAHRWSSPTTYCHLLCEGHIILRTALNTVFWTPGSSEALPSTFEQKEMTKLEELYRESCALLADYYVMSDNEEDWNMAAPYYRMAGFTPMEVVNRDSNSNLKGLMCYLHTCLMQLNQAPGDVLFNPAVPSFAHTLLDLFEEFDPAQVSTLVLHSSLLREYATDRVLGIMKKQLSIRYDSGCFKFLSSRLRLYACIVVLRTFGNVYKSTGFLNMCSHNVVSTGCNKSPLCILCYFKMNDVIDNPADCEVRSVIRFLNARHLKPAEIYRQLKKVCGDTVMNERNVRKWCEMFNNGRTNVHDETRPGRPTLITEDLKTKVNDRILQDRRTSLDELHIAFPDISRSLLGEIVSQHLGYHKICARWVPRQLSDQHKTQRIASALTFLMRYHTDGDAFLDQIVTGDEIWVSHNTPETKRQSRQWHHPSSPKKPRKFKQTLSTQKVMATVFWDRKGVLLLDFMPKGTTINANRYCETLRKLQRAIQNKRRGMLSRGVVLLHDNARPPDLAPSDFHLFTKLKDFLGGTRFGSDEELKKTVNTWLNELVAEEYNTGILKLVNRYDKCLNRLFLLCRAVPVAADALALVLLCIQRGSPEQAIAVLDSLSPDSLTKILIDNPSLLLEQQSPTQNFRGSSPHSVQKSSDSPPQYNKKGNSPNLRPSPSRGGENVPSFSELASILMDSKPGVLADVLADLVMVSQYATLQLILQVFLEYIPSRIGIAGSAASHVLQRFLEKYFAWYFNELTPQDSPASYDMATVEALKILVRSYLSDLQRFNLNSSAKIIDSDAALNSKNSGSLSDTKVSTFAIHFFFN
ncbi:hypothetical protein ANN_18085, partial [Periplaneta americana]